MKKYFIELWWESSGKRNVLIEEEYDNKAQQRGEVIKKQIIQKLKEVGSEGNCSDVNFSIKKVDFTE